MNRFELNDRVEIYGLPEFSADAIHNGVIGKIVALPGYNRLAKLAYGVEFTTGPNAGQVEPCIEKFLRPFPPKLPNGRGDTDKVLTWEEFDKATGLQSIGFRRPNHDY